MRASLGHLGITGKEEELWEEQEHMREKVFVTDPFTLVLNVITKRTHGQGGNYPFVTVNQNQSLPSRVTELKSGSANSCVFSKGHILLFIHHEKHRKRLQKAMQE